MFSYGSRQISIMVLFAITLHYVWTVTMWIDPEAFNATALSAIHRWLGDTGTEIAVPTAATLALIGLFVRPYWFIFLLIPQQLLLTMSASGAIEAIWISQFADGIIRTRGFLTVDQSYSIIAALGHTTAIAVHAWGSYAKGR